MKLIVEIMAVLSFQKAEMHYHCDMRCTEKVSLQKNHHHLMIHNHRYQCHHHHHCDVRRTEKGKRQDGFPLTLFLKTGILAEM